MKNSSKLSMIWLLSYISIASVSAAAITPALPNMEHSFSLSTGTIEWVVSAFLIGYVIGQLIYGPLSNIYGRLKALQLGLNINILGVFLCLIASLYPHYPLLLLGRLITGFGSAAGLTCTFILINEWLPEERRKIAMSYSILSFALGNGFAVLIGGIITQYINWQSCFIFLLLQGLIMRFGLCAFDETLTEPKQFHMSSLLRDYGHALCSYKLLAFSAIWGACTAVGYCYAAAAPQIAYQYLHLSVSEYGYWNSINIIGMLTGGLSARLLIHYFSVLTVITLGYIGCSFALLSLISLLYLHSHSVLWFFGSTAILYSCSAYLFAGGSYVASNAIADKASASSMMSFINMGVATSCVVIMGYLSVNPFYGFLEILVGVFCLTFLFFISFLFNPKVKFD